MDDFEKILESISLDNAGLQNQLISFASITNIILSTLSGFVVFIIYYYSTEKSKRDFSLFQIIPSLSVLMTVIMRMQGGRVAIFFGIFGVLSIVRFRSVLTDQKGITFILFSIINGLLIGLGNYVLSLIAIIFVSLIFVISKHIIKSNNRVLVTVKSKNLSQTSQLIEDFFKIHKINFNFLTPTLKFDINKNNHLEDFSKLEYYIYYKTDRQLIDFYDNLIEMIKSNEMQIEIKKIEEQ